eukprot:TRINITY_DN11666_c0_g1_i1.p1 TRINITY_DN11666_c0_g1~~TRINITY_DN11666_c0_g1_i1.p1  ORF type:complete len:584 (-),score=144.66 TRINITY_DN11666_c0_g1_i1:60-1790(-)
MKLCRKRSQTHLSASSKNYWVTSEKASLLEKSRSLTPNQSSHRTISSLRLRNDLLVKTSLDFRSWKQALKHKVDQVRNENDLRKRLKDVGEKLVVLYNFCSADDELLPYLYSLSKDRANSSMVFLKNNMDTHDIPELSDAPCFYFYYSEKQIFSCSGVFSERSKVKEALLTLSKPSTGDYLKLCDKVRRIQNALNLSSIKFGDIVEEFYSRLNFSEADSNTVNLKLFKTVIFSVLEKNGTVIKKSGLDKVTDDIQRSIDLLEASKAPSDTNVAEAVSLLEKTKVQLEQQIDSLPASLPTGLTTSYDGEISSGLLNRIATVLFKLFGEFALVQSTLPLDNVLCGLSLFLPGKPQEKIETVFLRGAETWTSRSIPKEKIYIYFEQIFSLIRLNPSCQSTLKHLKSLTKDVEGEQDSIPLSYFGDDSTKLKSLSPLFEWAKIFQRDPVQAAGQNDDEDIAPYDYNCTDLYFQAMNALTPLKPDTNSSLFGKVTHPGTQCDKCNQSPIVGARYYCMDCEERNQEGTYVGGYDLCERCFLIAKEEQKKDGTFGHDAEHEFIELSQPEYVVNNLEAGSCYGM